MDDVTSPTPGGPVRHTDSPSPGERMLEVLVAGLHRLTPAEVPDLVARAAAVIGGREVELYVVDLEQLVLVPFPGRAGDPAGADELAVDGTVAGRAYRTDRLVAGEEVEGGGTRIWAPLVDGAERIGVLGLVLDNPGELALRRCGVGARRCRWRPSCGGRSCRR